MKLTLTQVNRKTVTSQKTGKPFESVSIQAQEYGSRWLNGFGRKDNKAWKAGDVVEVEVTESTRRDTQGNPYLNFTMPQMAQGGSGLSDEDRSRLIRIELAVQSIVEHLKNAPKPASDDEGWVSIKPEDLPF